MSADLAPQPALPVRLVPTGRPTGLRRLDRERLLAWNARRAKGESHLTAWAAILTDPQLGQRDYRNGRAVPTAVLSRTFSRWMARVAPTAARDALNAARLEAATVLPRVVHLVTTLAEGDFGEGRVVVKGRGDDKREIVEHDAAGAAVRLSALRTLAQFGGLLQDGSAGSKTAVQINNINGPQEQNARDHDTYRAILDASKRDPEVLTDAIDLARRLAPQVPDAAGDERPRDPSWRGR